MFFLKIYNVDKLKRNDIRSQLLLYHMTDRHDSVSIFELRPFSMAREWALSRNLLSKDLSDFNLHITSCFGAVVLYYMFDNF
jgi:hypothetical protein